MYIGRPRLLRISVHRRKRGTSNLSVWQLLVSVVQLGPSREAVKVGFGKDLGLALLPIKIETSALAGEIGRSPASFINIVDTLMPSSALYGNLLASDDASPG